MIYVGIILISLILFVFIYALSKNKKPFKRAFLSMLFGILSLVAINIAGQYMNINIPISSFSITVAACGGIPAVAAMVIINTLL